MIGPFFLVPLEGSEVVPTFTGLAGIDVDVSAGFTLIHHAIFVLKSSSDEHSEDNEAHLGLNLGLDFGFGGKVSK